MNDQIKNFNKDRNLSKAEKPSDKIENKVFESMVETMIIKSSYLNEGNNGIIKTFKISDMDDDLRKFFEENYPEIMADKEKMAVKMLKIYSGGKGKHEYEAQKETYDLVNGKDDDSFAKIPKPYFYHDLELKTETAISKLKQEGLHLTKNRIEILVMDYIEGEDLAEYLYREVLRHHPDCGHIRDQIDDMPLSDLHAYVSNYLGFSKGAGKHRKEEMNLFEKEKANSDNAKKLVSFLKRQKDFVLPPIIIDKLENTINLLNNNGVIHGDAHERNVMIKKNPDNSIEDVYLLDFGGTQKADGEDKLSLQADEWGNRLVDDKMIINRYRPLTRTIEEDIKTETDGFLSELADYKKRLDNSPSFDKFHTELEKADTAEALMKTIDMFVCNQAGFVASEEHWRIKCLAIMEAKTVKSELMPEYMKSLRSEKIPAFGVNMLNRLERSLYNNLL